MARVSTYLNFSRSTEKAFIFYESVFGGEFEGSINRLSEVPPKDGQPPIKEKDKNLVMHVALNILDNHVLRGTDTPELIDQNNNVSICLEPDTKAETNRLFKVLSRGGKVTMPLQKMFLGDYFGSCTDKFGIQWTFDYRHNKDQ